MSEVQRGRGITLRSQAGDVIAKRIVKVRLRRRELDALKRADRHSVDHSTAHFFARRSPTFPDIDRRARSVTRGLIEMGITHGARKPARISQRFSKLVITGRTRWPGGRPVRQLLAAND
jgi:hypothetical protein